ncbi:MAG: molybdopterin molybdotransferase MoeA [Nitritalea sp.]
MISVQEAKTHLRTFLADKRSIIQLPIAEAHGHRIASELHAPIAVPMFDNAAMDGYALRLAEFQAGPLRVQGEIPAGIDHVPALAPGTAARIFTGAPIPKGADTVVMQEWVALRDGHITPGEQPPKPLFTGQHIRLAGSQTAIGDQVASPGMPLHAAMVGFLAGMGFAEIPVYKKPSIQLMQSGEELITPGKLLNFGQIYESNSYTIQTALREAHFTVSARPTLPDHYETIRDSIAEGLATHEVLLIMGGISVGDHDHVYRALQENGVETLFYKVKQRPGKPFYAGTKGSKLVFALPGNPASTLTCFYTYVLPALQLLSGQREDFPEGILLPSSDVFDKKVPLTLLLKGIYTPAGVRILGGQESYKMDAFAQANCIVEVPETQEKVEKGGSVRVYPFRSEPFN